MKNFNPMRHLPPAAKPQSQDVMVIFGEVFQRGYVNGMIDEAEKHGVKVIYSTVGRRDKDNTLRPLTAAEIEEKKQHPLINIPLEAGFDLEPGLSGKTPCDQLEGVKLSVWEDARLDWKDINKSRENGATRFRNSVRNYLAELEKHIPENANIIFVHTMAGGFPRAKVVMPAANRVFKGSGDRYYSSEKFWNTDIGKLCEMSFSDVTGETFYHLIDLTSNLRQRIEKSGRSVSYVAYGYHGTEVLIDNKIQWQSYAPYLQGWAKLRLEDIARKSWEGNVKAMVFNAPEILTNSSSIFLGVEIALYPLLATLKNDPIVKQCLAKLKVGTTVNDIIKKTDEYLTSKTIKAWSHFDIWPQHNGPEQMALMRQYSSDLIEMHKDTKDLITADLSEVVFKACGHLMFAHAYQPEQPVWWLGHDIISASRLQANS